MTKAERPLGISIISILDIIFGLFAMLGGLLLIVLGSIINYIPTNEFQSIHVHINIPKLIMVFGFVIGVFLLIFGVIGILLGYFLWKGNEFARLLHIVLAILGILSGIITGFNNILSGILSIIINLIIIYYLTRGYVKIFFKPRS